MGREVDLLSASCERANSQAPRCCPLPGYVIKTDIIKRGNRAFINVCMNDEIGGPSIKQENGHRDGWCLVPYGLACPSDALAKRGDRCRVFDFAIHPNTFKMTEASAAFKKAINDLAIDGIAKQFNVRLDKKNLAFPEMAYKGTANSVKFVEKVGSIAVDLGENELQEFFSNKISEEKIHANSEIHSVSQFGSEDNVELAQPCDQAKTDADSTQATNGSPQESSGLKESENLEYHCEGESVVEKAVEERAACPGQQRSSLARTDVADSLVLNGNSLSDAVPEYECLQDRMTVTFIFAVENVKKEDAVLIFKSPQEIVLKMVAMDDGRSPRRYVCCLKFGNKHCRVMEGGCRVDSSDSNVVLTVAKAEMSHGVWSTYFIGTSFQHLEVRDFTTVDNLRRELESLDVSGASTDVKNKEELITEIQKAEEKEMEDVPGEIVIVHDRGVPKLHGILKQRSMSESSDDVSCWSWSVDRRQSTTTGSESESEDFEGSPIPFRPCLKKSVSFSERIDETTFVVSQSVSQMHAALKNKRRKIRKREQKHEQKEARRRYRSVGEGDYAGCGLSFDVKAKSVPAKFAAEVVGVSADKAKAELLSSEEDLTVYYQDRSDLPNVEELHKSLRGTSVSGLAVADSKSALGTYYDGVSNGEAYGLSQGNFSNVNMCLGDEILVSASKSSLYEDAVRTSLSGDVSAESALKNCDKISPGYRTLKPVENIAPLSDDENAADAASCLMSKSCDAVEGDESSSTRDVLNGNTYFSNDDDLEFQEFTCQAVEVEPPKTSV